MRAVAVTGNLAETVAQYMTERTGAIFTPGMYTSIAILNSNDEFAAAVVISNWRGQDCEISCASETPAAWRPHVCKYVFEYVFRTLGCVRCTSITTRGNKHARAFLTSFGFVLEGNLRLGYDGKRDALLYGLLASECRYLAGGLNGEEIRASSADAARSGSDG